MKIENWNSNDRVLVIAEIGNNHEGDFELAEKMIGLAAQAGADAVKFQTIVPEKLVSSSQQARIEQLRKYQFSYEQFEKLSKTALKENVLFFSTPFDIESAQFLNSIVPAYKIASGDNNFFPLIEVIAETGKPIILSTGLVDLDEVKRTKEFIQRVWDSKKITQEMAFLHCVVSYPTSDHDANLLAIRELLKLGVTAGYSDHTLGIEAAILSVVLGARIIEKHFTISKTHSTFRDHSLSADPKDMAELVRKVRQAEQMLGCGKKQPQKSEKEIIPNVRRSIVAGRNLNAGETLTKADLLYVRPAGGLAPEFEVKLAGRKLKKPIKSGELILLEDVE
jgi:N,N'-diacetyllegionaminate synthase